jgi:hypothetical protein
VDTDRLRQLAAEYIRTAVARGRSTCAAIVDDAADYLHGEGDPAELRALAWRLVPEAFEAHRPATQVGEEVAAALRAEGLHVDWDDSAGRRIHVRLDWARRRHDRVAAFVGSEQAMPDVAAMVANG